MRKHSIAHSSAADIARPTNVLWEFTCKPASSATDANQSHFLTADGVPPTVLRNFTGAAGTPAFVAILKHLSLAASSHRHLAFRRLPSDLDRPFAPRPPISSTSKINSGPTAAPATTHVRRKVFLTGIILGLGGPDVGWVALYWSVPRHFRLEHLTVRRFFHRQKSVPWALHSSPWWRRAPGSDVRRGIWKSGCGLLARKKTPSEPTHSPMKLPGDHRYPYQWLLASQRLLPSDFPPQDEEACCDPRGSRSCPFRIDSVTRGSEEGVDQTSSMQGRSMFSDLKGGWVEWRPLTKPVLQTLAKHILDLLEGMSVCTASSH